MEGWDESYTKEAGLLIFINYFFLVIQKISNVLLMNLNLAKKTNQKKKKVTIPSFHLLELQSFFCLRYVPRTSLPILLHILVITHLRNCRVQNYGLAKKFNVQQISLFLFCINFFFVYFN